MDTPLASRLESRGTPAQGEGDYEVGKGSLRFTSKDHERRLEYACTCIHKSGLVGGYSVTNKSNRRQRYMPHEHLWNTVTSELVKQTELLTMRIHT